MALYYFNIIYPDGSRVEDVEGGEFLDSEKAAKEAAANLRDLLVEAVRRGSTALGLKLEITSEGGEVVGVVEGNDLLRGKAGQSFLH